MRDTDTHFLFQCYSEISILFLNKELVYKGQKFEFWYCFDKRSTPMGLYLKTRIFKSYLKTGVEGGYNSPR